MEWIDYIMVSKTTGRQFVSVLVILFDSDIGTH